jgi:catechol 2,3-dioxygenase-like lactoylglutathione lyase family enzyme
MSFLATTDLDRAKDFFTNILALPLREEDGWGAMFENGGTILRVQRVNVVNPAPYTVLGWEVDDISAIIRTLIARGVSFQRVPGLEQDELGVWTTPDGTEVAWFKDPDGNVLSFTQFGHKILKG